MPYADRTTVPVEQTTLTRYGADRFAYFVEPKGSAVISFSAKTPEPSEARPIFNLGTLT
jgi:hypothetical protein